MKRTGYAAGGSIGDAPLDSYGSWTAPSASGVATSQVGAMPQIPGAGAAAGGVPAGGNFASTGGESGGGEAAYQHGGPVRRRRRRRRRLLRPRPRPLLDGRHPPRRLRRRLRPRRRLRTGYAGGGTVNPLLMSVSLDSRSKNPAHYAEDREPLATRPEGAPGAPNEFGYARGGVVTGYQEGGEVYDEEYPIDEFSNSEELPEETEEPDVPEEPEGTEDLPTEPPEEREGAAPPEEDEGEGAAQPEEDEGGGGPSGGGPSGGGGGGDTQPPSGARPQAQQDEEDIPAAAQPTGYSPDAAPAQTPLKEVLDYTRKQFGIGQEKPAAPTEPPPSDREAAANEVASRIPVPAGEPTGRTGIGAPNEEVPETPPPPQQQFDTAAPAAPGMPAPAPAAPPPRQSIVTGPNQAPRGEDQGIDAYASGKRALSQDEMTQLLDRTNQTNPNIDQNGAIHKAFNDLVAKGDIDNASKFMQALRPSYDNMRALMIAAVAKGDFNAAMQVADKMNNLIPNGQQVQFAQGNGGIINAIIKPENGGQPTVLQMTPDQFARYANSPLSLFDHTAEQGLAKNFAMVGAQERQQYNAPGDIPQGAPPGSRNVQIPDGRTLTVAPDPGSYERGQPTYNRGLVVSETPTGQRPYDITSPANARISQGQPGNPYGTAAERANPRIGYSGTASDRFDAPYGQLGRGPAPPMPDGSPGGYIPAYPPAPRAGVAGTQFAENRTGNTMSDAAPIGYQQTAQAAPAAPATPPATGYNQPQRGDYNVIKRFGPNGDIYSGMGTATPATPANAGMPPQRSDYTVIQRPSQQPGQQGQAQKESREMMQWRASEQARLMFPMSNQRTQRGYAEKQIYMQMLRDEEKQRYSQTPEDKRSLETMKEQGRNERAKMASEDKRFQTQTSRDNAWLTAVQRNMTAARSKAIDAMIAERKAYESSQNYDPKKPWIPSEEQKALMQDVYKTAVDRGMFRQGPTPPPGGNQLPQPQQQQQAPAPAPAPAQDRYTTTYPGNKDRPDEPPQIRLEPGERWLKGSKGNWKLERIPK